MGSSPGCGDTPRFTMRGVFILAALLQLLLGCIGAAVTSYDCPKDQDSNATDEALHFINELHHHGYKFKLVSVDSRTAHEKADPCEVVMALTLEETHCHIVDPKPFSECEPRSLGETKVTAKCNVTICGGGKKPGIKEYTCDTEPTSREELVKICPDCPSLLPLHDPKGLESVKAALEKFNVESNHTSYFALMEVGRLTTQFNMKFGQTYFAEFAIVETECSDTVKPEEKHACKPLCDQEAHHGFCKSTQLGNEEMTVACEIYDVQNTTHHRHAPFHKRHCGYRHGHGKRPEHAGSGHGKRPDHAGSGHGKHPDHAGSGHGKRPDHAGSGHDKHPDHAGSGHGKRPDHAGSGHGKRPDHAGSGHDKHHDHASHPSHHGVHTGCFVRSDDHPHHRGPPHRRGPPHHEGHPEHKKDSTKPTHHPPGSSDPIEFPFPQCHGFVKIPPSIHPICPFPPAFMRRGHGPSAV